MRDAQPPPRCACFYLRLYPRWLNTVVLLLHHAHDVTTRNFGLRRPIESNFAGKGCKRLLLLIASVCHSTYCPIHRVCVTEYRKLYNFKLELNLNDLLHSLRKLKNYCHNINNFIPSAKSIRTRGIFNKTLFLKKPLIINLLTKSELDCIFFKNNFI